MVRLDRYTILALLIVSFIVSCTVKQAAEKPVYTALWSKQEWTDFTLDALDKYGQDLLKAEPTDAIKYCPKFKSVDRKQFYLALISQLAKFESGFNPNETYTESFDDAKGSPVVSRGLLQISIESGKGYGCEIPMAVSLQDPKTNLECGVKILNRWIPKDGVIQGGQSGAWKGAARYWSPFRKDFRVQTFRTYLSALPGCN